MTLTRVGAAWISSRVVTSWCVTEHIDVVETGEPARVDESALPKQASVTHLRGLLLSKGMLVSLVRVLILVADVNWTTQLLETDNLAGPTVL